MFRIIIALLLWTQGAISSSLDFSSSNFLSLGDIIDSRSLVPKGRCNLGRIDVSDPESPGRDQFQRSLDFEEIQQKTFTKGSWLNINWNQEQILFQKPIVAPNVKTLHYLALINGPVLTSGTSCRELQEGESFINKVQLRAFYLVTLNLEFIDEFEKNKWMNNFTVESSNLFSIWNYLSQVPAKFSLSIGLSQIGGGFSELNNHLLATLPLLKSCESRKWSQCIRLAKSIYSYAFGKDGVSAQLRSRLNERDLLTSVSTSYGLSHYPQDNTQNDLERLQEIRKTLNYKTKLSKGLLQLERHYEKGHIAQRPYLEYREDINAFQSRLEIYVSHCLGNFEDCELIFRDVISSLDSVPDFTKFKDSLSSFCQFDYLLPMEDKEFIEVLKNKLNRQNCDELQRVLGPSTYLDLSYSSVRSLRLIRFFSQLGRLDISGNPIDSFWPLGQLFQLKVLEAKQVPGLSEAKIREVNSNISLIIL